MFPCKEDADGEDRLQKKAKRRTELRKNSNQNLNQSRLIENY